jgi:LmbE family N-acetylglucosaminyl deacetylase
MRLVALSPHLDDGVAFAGSFLAAAAAFGCEVFLVTLFAGQPALDDMAGARQVFGKVDLQGLICQRRREDVEACAALRVRCMHVDFPEALFRGAVDGTAPRYSKLEEVLNGSIWDELDTIRSCVSVIGLYLGELLPDVLLVPAGASKHIDHRVTSVAARRVAHGLSSAGIALAVIEYCDKSVAAFELEDRPFRWRVSAQRASALACYASQRSLLEELGVMRMDWETFARLRNVSPRP